MAIPPFREDGWLPEGHHAATWEEVVAVFGGEPGSQRAAILVRLLAWRDALRQKGFAGLLIVDGSFILKKSSPGDVDCVFVYDDSRVHVEDDEEAKALTDYIRLKEQGVGDIFAFPLSLTRAHPDLYYLDVFDYDKTAKQPKGVLEVEL